MSAYLGSQFLNNSFSYRHIVYAAPAQQDILPIQHSSLPVQQNDLPKQRKILPKPQISTPNPTNNQSQPAPSEFYLSPSLFNTPYSLASTPAADPIEKAFISDSRLQAQLRKVYLERINMQGAHPPKQASHVVLEALLREASEEKSNSSTRMAWLQILTSILFEGRKQILEKTVTEISYSLTAGPQDEALAQHNINDFNVDVFRMHRLFKTTLRNLLSINENEKDFQLIVNEFRKKIEIVSNNLSAEMAMPVPSEKLIGNIKAYAGILYEAFFIFYQKEKKCDLYSDNASFDTKKWREINEKFIKIKQEAINIISQEERKKYPDQRSINYMKIHINLLNENFFKIYEILNKIFQPEHDIYFINQDWSNTNSIFANMEQKLTIMKEFEAKKEVVDKKFLDIIEGHINILNSSFFCRYQQKNLIAFLKTNCFMNNIV